MKLRTKLILYIVESVLIAVVVLSILFNTLFTSSFNQYLKTVQMDRFEKLKGEISYLMSLHGIDSIPKELARYAGNESIEIEVRSPEGKTVAKYNELKEIPDASIVRKDYSIMDQGQVIGTMYLSYYSNSYYDHLSTAFQKRYTLSILGAGAVALVVGIMTSFYLSGRLSKAITSLTETALAYRNREYDTKPAVSTGISELQTLSDSMAYLGSSLSAQEEIRRRYAQDISHELRTPLTNLQLHLEAIRDEVIELNDETINTLIEEIYHLNKMVDQLKTSFNKGLDEDSIHWSRVDLSSELLRMNAIIAPTMRNRGIRLRSEVEKEIMIETDRDKLIQIMYNLLSNASKAITEKGTITVRLTTDDNIARITVIDNGIGIEQKDQEKIFERFYRVDDARANRLGGSGLGLSIVRNLTERLGGSLELQSEPNKGTAISVLLPFAREV